MIENAINIYIAAVSCSSSCKHQREDLRNVHHHRYYHAINNHVNKVHDHYLYCISGHACMAKRSGVFKYGIFYSHIHRAYAINNNNKVNWSTFYSTAIIDKELDNYCNTAFGLNNCSTNRNGNTLNYFRINKCTGVRKA